MAAQAQDQSAAQSHSHSVRVAAVTVMENRDPHFGPHETEDAHYSPQFDIDEDATKNKIHMLRVVSGPKETRPRLLRDYDATVTSHPTLTPFRRRTYLCLLSIPEGQWTTYAALAKHLGSSARAVGTAMRLNPFAPGVPCHRVLNVDGGLGGYMGTKPDKGIGKNGVGFKGKENLERKRRILESEGVMFDEKRKAIGRAFLGFPTV
ncbi:6-O-methylguanine DNA methyltransferase [Aspergillus californicus]